MNRIARRTKTTLLGIHRRIHEICIAAKNIGRENLISHDIVGLSNPNVLERKYKSFVPQVFVWIYTSQSHAHSNLLLSCRNTHLWVEQTHVESIHVWKGPILKVLERTQRSNDFVVARTDVESYLSDFPTIVHPSCVHDSLSTLSSLDRSEHSM